MSGAIEIPSGGANSGTETPGADSGVKAPGSQGQQNGSTDYVGRIRSDPDFAEREALAHQSRADSAEAKLKTLGEWTGDLEKFKAQYTGSELAQFVDQYAAALNEPVLREAIQTFHATGKVKISQQGSNDTPADEDEYKSPEQIEIDTLKQKLATLEPRIAQQEAGVGQAVLKDHLVKIFGELELAPEVRDRVDKKLEGQLRTWAGSENGLETIRGLMTPNGHETVRALVYGSLTQKEIHEGVMNHALRTGNKLDALSTGGPSGEASSGQEPPPEFASAFKAMEWARRNPEAHDSR